ncbi:hypothetical protein OH799_33445 [Nocardia sp. NBC_00881]|nr:hypothetical protein OH799_33445 [Nocardia sp. NBC_00881]
MSTLRSPLGYSSLELTNFLADTYRCYDQRICRRAYYGWTI